MSVEGGPSNIDTQNIDTQVDATKEVVKEEPKPELFGDAFNNFDAALSKAKDPLFLSDMSVENICKPERRLLFDLKNLKVAEGEDGTAAVNNLISAYEKSRYYLDNTRDQDAANPEQRKAILEAMGIQEPDKIGKMVKALYKAQNGTSTELGVSTKKSNEEEWQTFGTKLVDTNDKLFGILTGVDKGNPTNVETLEDNHIIKSFATSTPGMKFQVTELTDPDGKVQATESLNHVAPEASAETAADAAPEDTENHPDSDQTLVAPPQDTENQPDKDAVA